MTVTGMESPFERHENLRYCLGVCDRNMGSCRGGNATALQQAPPLAPSSPGDMQLGMICIGEGYPVQDILHPMILLQSALL